MTDLAARTGPAAVEIWPGPGPDLPGADVLDPLTAGALAIHLTGALAASGATAAGVGFLRRNRDLLPAALPATVAGLGAGTFVADFISGILHWAFDTWFDEDIQPLRRMVFLVREHHLHPERIHRYKLRDEAGILAWFGLLGAVPFHTAAFMPAGRPGPVRYGCAVAGVTVATEVVLMLEFHKGGHRPPRSRLARALQRSGLVLSPAVHMRHHRGNHDEHYCIVTGWADMTLGRLGVFRALERAVTVVTGAVPRESDHEWARRYRGSGRVARRGGAGPGSAREPAVLDSRSSG